MQNRIHNIRFIYTSLRLPKEKIHRYCTVITLHGHQFFFRVYNRYWYHNSSYFFLEPRSKCFDVSFRKMSDNSNWAIGTCYSSLQYQNPGIYIERCCVLPGDHILTCIQPDNDDWSQGVLTLLGHEFCNDYVGNIAMIQLNIERKIANRKSCTLIFVTILLIEFIFDNEY